MGQGGQNQLQKNGMFFCNFLKGQNIHRRGGGGGGGRRGMGLQNCDLFLLLTNMVFVVANNKKRIIIIIRKCQRERERERGIKNKLYHA